MRLKKILLFLGIIPLLTACQKASISGIYGFQLGKDSSTHFGVSMALSDDAYIRLGSPEDYNKMTLSLSAYISQNVEDTTQPVPFILPWCHSPVYLAPLGHTRVPVPSGSPSTRSPS